MRRLFSRKRTDFISEIRSRIEEGEEWEVSKNELMSIWHREREEEEEEEKKKS